MVELSQNRREQSVCCPRLGLRTLLGLSLASPWQRSQMWTTAQLLVHFAFVVVVLWDRASLCICPEAGIPDGWLLSAVWILEVKPWFSGRASSSLNCWTITPVLPISTNPSLCLNYIYCARVHAYAHTVQIWRSEDSLPCEFGVWTRSSRAFACCVISPPSIVPFGPDVHQSPVLSADLCS